MSQEQPLDCPFCGEELRPHYNHGKTEVIAWVHPGLSEMREEYGEGYWCFMQGNSIGAKLVKYWNHRSSAPVVAPPPPPPPPFAAAKPPKEELKWASFRFRVNGGEQVFALHGMVNISDTKGIFNGDRTDQP